MVPWLKQMLSASLGASSSKNSRKTQHAFFGWFIPMWRPRRSALLTLGHDSGRFLSNRVDNNEVIYPHLAARVGVGVQNTKEENEQNRKIKKAGRVNSTQRAKSSNERRSAHESALAESFSARVEWRRSEWRISTTAPRPRRWNTSGRVPNFDFFPLPDRFSALWLLIKCQEAAPEVRTAVIIFQ